MRQTLFTIPYEVAGVPIFGLGLLLALWSVLSLGVVVWQARKEGVVSALAANLPPILVIGAAILWLPTVFPGGLPIRGYGVMLLLAAMAGIGLALVRARQVGLADDTIWSLAFWLFIPGIVGARLFHVIEYWQYGYRSASVWETFLKVINIPQGGLVVYGSVFGAAVGLAFFVRRRRLPALALADLIAPSLVLGLAIGRIGCLLNGCCFGGVCDLPWAITFPARAAGAPEHETPPYAQQHQTGRLHGIAVEGPLEQPPTIRFVDPAGPAARAGLKVGDPLTAINGVDVHSIVDAERVLWRAGPQIELRLADGRKIAWSVGTLPERSLPVHPTQIYSAVTALLVAFCLWNYYPLRRRDGEVIAALLTIYPVLRFLLEAIRVDEPAVFRTGLSISQNVSLLLAVLVMALWVYVLRQPRGTAFERSAQVIVS